MRIAWGFLAMGLVAGMGGTTTAVVAPAAQATPRATIPNLRAYWSFEGNANDVSGNGHDGTIQSGASLVATPSPYPGSTQSVQLTQSNNQSYVLVPSSANLDLNGPLTLAAWVRPTNASVANQQGIIERFGGGGGYILRLSTSEDMNTTIFSGATSSNITTAGSPASRRVEVGEWNHVAMTFDGTTHRNIEEAGTEFTPASADPTATAANPPNSTTAALHIGRDYGSNGFEGQIDEARIYSRALNLAELGILMTGQAPPSGLTTTSGPGLIDISWTAPPAIPGVTVTYALKRSPPGANTWTILAEGLTATNYTDSGYVAITTWDYAVTAVSVDESAPTAVVQGSSLSLVPRTNDHEEGLFDDKCACGTSIPGPTSGGLALALAALALLVLARRA